jgi:F-type H+-transporting ATPase subunit b
MDELIQTFHIDWKLLIAQLINFAIVVIVLGVFAVKPLLKLMTSREEKITKGVEDAKQAEVELSNAEEIKKEKEKEGRKEAQVIIEKAEKDGEGVRKEKVDKAQGEVQKVIDDAKSRIKSDKDKMASEVNSNARDLIVAALEKITEGNVDAQTHSKLIDQAIKDVKTV